jgi:hypothetical protein
MSTDGPTQQSGLAESRFKAQVEQHDSCQSFASEILRLCLGGIAVVGFLLPLLSPAGQGTPSPASPGVPGQANLLSDLYILCSLVGSTIFLGLGSALALRHKYCEASALYYHLRAEGMSFPTENDHEDNSTHREKQNTYFRQGQRSLSGAAICLGLGAAGLIVAFVRFTYLRA